jgi:hypothetical protein
MLLLAGPERSPVGAERRACQQPAADRPSQPTPHLASLLSGVVSRFFSGWPSFASVTPTGLHRELEVPTGDLLIHAGDCSFAQNSALLISNATDRVAHQAAGLADFPASSASFSASLQAFMECSSACLLSS